MLVRLTENHYTPLSSKLVYRESALPRSVANRTHHFEVNERGRFLGGLHHEFGLERTARVGCDLILAEDDGIRTSRAIRWQLFTFHAYVDELAKILDQR